MLKAAWWLNLSAICMAIGFFALCFFAIPMAALLVFPVLALAISQLLVLAKTMSPVEQRWRSARDAILQEVAGLGAVTCRTSWREPVDLASGLLWLQSSIYEGCSVAHKIEREPTGVVVRLKKWEYGEEEPAWTA